MTRHKSAGSGTVLTIVLVAAMLILLPLVLGLVSALQANQRARGAADLGALAAAAAFAGGRDAALSCRHAARFVRANRAELAECSISAAGRVALEVRVGVNVPPVGYRSTTARAWAGPVLVS